VYSNDKNVSHSGEGRLVGNVISFVIFFVMFAGGIYALSFWSLDNAWFPSILCFALVSLGFAIPMHLMGRADSAEVTMHQND